MLKGYQPAPISKELILTFREEQQITMGFARFSEKTCAHVGGFNPGHHVRIT